MAVDFDAPDAAAIEDPAKEGVVPQVFILLLLGCRKDERLGCFTFYFERAMATEGKRKIRRLWTPEEDQLVKELFAKSETFWVEYFKQEDEKNKSTKGIEDITATRKKKAKKNNRAYTKRKKSGPKSIFGRIAYVMRAQERTTKQVRERWINHLAPGIVKDYWTPEEDQLILDQYQCVGPK